MFSEPKAPSPSAIGALKLPAHRSACARKRKKSSVKESSPPCAGVTGLGYSPSEPEESVELNIRIVSILKKLKTEVNWKKWFVQDLRLLDKGVYWDLLRKVKRCCRMMAGRLVGSLLMLFSSSELHLMSRLSAHPPRLRKRNRNSDRSLLAFGPFTDEPVVVRSVLCYVHGLPTGRSPRSSRGCPRSRPKTRAWRTCGAGVDGRGRRSLQNKQHIPAPETCQVSSGSFWRLKSVWW